MKLFLDRKLMQHIKDMPSKLKNCKIYMTFYGHLLSILCWSHYVFSYCPSAVGLPARTPYCQAHSVSLSHSIYLSRLKWSCKKWGRIKHLRQGSRWIYSVEGSSQFKLTIKIKEKSSIAIKFLSKENTTSINKINCLWTYL